MTVDGDKNCSASFVLNQHDLNVATSGSGSGTVTSNIGGIDCGSTCSSVYNYGDNVTLTAAAADGSVFSGWTGDCSGEFDSVSFLVYGPKNCVAAFDQGTSYTLTVSIDPEGGGSVVGPGIACPGDCTETFAAGREVSLTASVSQDYSFDYWFNGTWTDSSNPIELIMNQDLEISAIFYSNAGSFGSGDSSSGGSCCWLTILGN